MGAASSFKRRIEDQSCGITALPGVDDFGDLTRFQNQVLDFAEQKEQEEKQRRQEEMQNGNSPQRNSRSPGRGGQAQSSDMGREETVRYVNKELNPNHDVHKSD